MRTYICTHRNWNIVSNIAVHIVKCWLLTHHRSMKGIYNPIERWEHHSTSHNPEFLIVVHVLADMSPPHFQKVQLRNNFNSIEQILNSIQYNQYKDLDDMPQNYGPQNLVMPNARFQYPHTSQCWSVLGWIFPSFLDRYSNLGQHPYRHSLPLEMPTLQMTVGLEISANTSRKSLPHKTSNKASQCYDKSWMW